MAEYIDRKAAIALAKDIIVPTKDGYAYRHRCIDPQDLAELPAADVVERKVGTWIFPTDIIGFGRCSECKALWDRSLIMNRFFSICPRCGSYNSYNGGDDDV